MKEDEDVSEHELPNLVKFESAPVQSTEVIINVLAENEPKRSKSLSYESRANDDSFDTPSMFKTQISEPIQKLLSQYNTRTFYCQICMGNEDIDEGYCLECGHHFCKTCIEQYLTIKVNEGEVMKIQCPFIDDKLMNGAGEGWICEVCTFFNANLELLENGRVKCEVCESEQDAPPITEPGCKSVVSENDFLGILNDESITKYHRFLEMKGNDHYRECPKCNAPSLKPPKSSNKITCAVCSYEFCFIHSDAHPGKGCRQYERTHRIEEARARAHISSFARACPKCKQPIEKSGGCNHMTCPNCKTDFCWLCGRRITGGTTPTHFAYWNIMGCPGTQMQENLRSTQTNNTLSSMRMCCYRVFYVFGCIMLPIVLLTMLAIYLSLSMVYVGFAIVIFVCCHPCIIYATCTEALPVGDLLQCACGPFYVIFAICVEIARGGTGD